VTTYSWKGKTLAGEIQKGEIAVETRQEVLDVLRKKRIIPVSVQEKSASVQIRLPLKRGMRMKELAVFTRQFATMVNSGLPLVQCLDILSQQAERAPVRAIVTEVMRDVEAGATLSEALAKRREAFDPLYTNMVDAGEAGGVLDQILLRLASYIEKAEALRRKVKSAMTYPTVVLVVALGTTAFMLVFIIPTFAKVFADYGGTLPLPTRIVLFLSQVFKKLWWAMGLGTAGLVFAVRQYYRTEGGRRGIDRLLLRVPILGPLLLKVSLARLTRTLGTLISSGVPILTGLEITARTAGNKVVEDAVMATRGSIREGETIAAPLRTSGVFPPMVVQMIAVGEETGQLDKMLDKIAVFYDDEVNTSVETLTSVIEPIMIVMMGLLVGGMIVAMYMPLFKLVNVVAGKG
jgi:type IV pilus assembly protein PilC